MRTFLLDQVLWDLVLDVSGNWAVASNPYSLAQDAASAIKTWLQEVWYDTTEGVPYRQQIFGRVPNIPLIKNRLVGVAKTVPGVVAAVCYITSIGADRSVRGQVQVTDQTGKTSWASF